MTVMIEQYILLPLSLRKPPAIFCLFLALRKSLSEMLSSKGTEKLCNKPAEVLSKILDGKVKKIFAETTLEHQPFLMDDSKTVGQFLKEKGIELLTFVRYQVGEGIEKRQDDFASEVMSQVK